MIERINSYISNHRGTVLPVLTVCWLSGMFLWLADIYTWWSIPLIVIAILVNLYGWCLIIKNYKDEDIV